MSMFKVSIFYLAGSSGCSSSVTVYEEKNTPKAAYEKGVDLAKNIFGENINSASYAIKVEQEPPAQ